MPPHERGLAFALAWLLTCASSCATGAAPRDGTAAARDAAATPPAERLVLATFSSTRPEVWRPALAEVSHRHGLRPILAWPMESIGEECVVFALRDAGRRDEALRALAAHPSVSLAAPVSRFHTLAAEATWNDPYAGLQPGLAELGVAAAQRWATGRGVKVAIVDTGVDLRHPDLAGRVAEARDFVARGDDSFTSDAHGTAMAGIIAAGTNNGLGIAGVAPGADLMALKACWPDPPRARTSACDTYTLARALDFALRAQARVVNLSLAGPEDPLLAKLLGRAEELGIVVVAAQDESGRDPFPASLPTVLGVRSAAGASPSAGGELAGAPGSVEAPGVDVLSTGPGGSYDFFTGSSLAAAHAAGIAALVLERRPELTPQAVRAILRDSARGGSRRLSACGALSRALDVDACAPR
jgi:subtilisin family serine protease